ncbi:hypothetical protein [Micromonospora coxensis]|uniref:Flagellar biosynthetic protein FliP n=1 Tax=Micromonospora coxensis TaxID=356852 RepID=A0A1C5JZC1_9ACTN|nr:hypothetical protein [Micromonospora coxensis]SCG75902.1 hypothetical protein GA0070614_5801 [Micromonospora coxensis]
MAPTNPTTPTRSRHAAARVVRPLVRHYVEMVIAMAVGMAVIGGLRSLNGLTVSFVERPGTALLLMATDMAVGMAVWMRVRRHPRAAILEMCAAMYVPVVLLPLVWTEVIGPTAFMVAVHVLMLIAMLAVLLRRRHRLGRC